MGWGDFGEKPRVGWRRFDLFRSLVGSEILVIPMSKTKCISDLNKGHLLVRRRYNLIVYGCGFIGIPECRRMVNVL